MQKIEIKPILGRLNQCTHTMKWLDFPVRLSISNKSELTSLSCFISSKLFMFFSLFIAVCDYFPSCFLVRSLNGCFSVNLEPHDLFCFLPFLLIFVIPSLKMIFTFLWGLFKYSLSMVLQFEFHNEQWHKSFLSLT